EEGVEGMEKGEEGRGAGGRQNEEVAARRNKVNETGAGVPWTTNLGGDAKHAPNEYVARADGAYAWDAYLGADGGAQEGKRCGVRPSVSDRDDSAPRRRFDHGERFVRYCRRRTGR